MADPVFDAPPSASELDRANTRLRQTGAPRTGPTAPRPRSIFDEAPTAAELNLAKSGGRTRLSPEEAANLARQQGFDDNSRGALASAARGLARTALTIPSVPAELVSLAGAGTAWAAGQIANTIDPKTPVLRWKDIPKTEDIPVLRHLGAQSLYDNIIGPDALNIYPHRRPDETVAEGWAGTFGEIAPAALGARQLMMRAVGRSAGPVVRTGNAPYVTAGQAARQRTQVNRIAASEMALGTAGAEIGAEIDRSQGGTGETGRVVGGVAAPLAPTVASGVGTTARFALRGGEKGRQAVADAVEASDRLSDMAGQTYQPTRTQRVLDAIGGGSGRPLNVTAGQAAPRRGIVRTVERMASYFPGGYGVMANKIADQIERAGQTVSTIARRAVDRYNAQARSDNASRIPRQSYQMQMTGRGATSALDETVPIADGLTDEVAGQAIDRGLRERVAMNDNLRRIAEADFQRLMPGDTQTAFDATMRALDDLEVRIPASPEVSQGTLRSPVIGNLRDELIDDAVSGPQGTALVPFEALRKVRERIGQFLQGDANALGPARMAEADARRLYAALTEDMATAARNAGPQTWLAWQTTQAVTRSGAEVASDIGKVLRPETWENLLKSVDSGSGSRVRDVMAAIPARDRELVVGNIFRRWGEATPGNQDAFGAGWSFDRWLTNVNRARQNGSLEALTTTGSREIAEAVDALNTIADRVRQRARFMPNPSGTGRVVLSGAAVMATAAGAVAAPALTAAVVATGFVAPNLISRLMVNPRFIRWLAKVDETPPNAMAGHIMRLGTFATNPETAEAVDAFTNAFMNEFEKGDALERAAMIDPTPISETAKQVKAYAADGRPMTGANLLASAGAIGMAALGLGGARGKAAKALPWTSSELRPVKPTNMTAQENAQSALQSGKYDLTPMQEEMSLIEDVYRSKPRAQVKTVLQLAQDQDARALRAGATDALRQKTDAALDHIVRLGTREALEAVARNSEAAQWYRKSVSDAVDQIARLHPQIKTDAVARARFMFGLAMTSNGQDVASNARYSEWVHNYYTANGRMPEKVPFGGARKPQIEKAFQQWNDLVQTMGGERQLIDFLGQQHKVGDLKKMGFNISGESVDVTLPGSVIFGPKVGAGFYSNLMGNFDPLTMDLWFMRTWGRRTGKLHVPMGDDQMQRQIRELRAALTVRKGAASKMAQFDPGLAGKSPKDLSDDEMIALAEKIYAEDLRNNFAKFRGKRPDHNMKAQRLIDGMERTLDQPGSGMDRRFQREAYTRILNNLRAEGIDISMADLQALDWYPEKNLFEARGVGNKRAAPTDYATEFRKLVEERLNGKTASAQ